MNSVKCSNHLLNGLVLVIINICIFSKIVETDRVPDKVCMGTNMKGFEPYPYVPSNWEDYYKETYTNCTHVVGNIQLVHVYMEGDYNEYFRHIREVTGYVLLHNFHLHHLTFPSLQVIRGQSLFRLNTVDPEYALLVRNPSFAPNLVNLTFPALREISNGSVLISSRTQICNLERIDWTEIMSGDNSEYVYHHFGDDKNNCEDCDESCSGYCWGEGSENCQKFSKKECSNECNGKRCFGPNQQDCCDPSCVGDCTGPSKTECLACKSVYYDGECLEECPHEMFSLGSSCVTTCPPEFVVDKSAKSCLAECPLNKLEKDGVCEEIIHPDKKCRGTSDFWPYIHLGNVDDFQDCTILDGSILLDRNAFNYNRYPLNFSRDKSYESLDMDSLEVFQTLRQINGILRIETDINDLFTNLSSFRNLNTIGDARRSFQNPLASGLFVTRSSLEAIGLRNLRSVGQVRMYYNLKLCYISSINWTEISHDEVFIEDNASERDCRAQGRICSTDCVENLGCWGMESWECQRCPVYMHNKECVDQCPSGFEGNDETGKCELPPTTTTTTTTTKTTPTTSTSSTPTSSSTIPTSTSRSSTAITTPGITTNQYLIPSPETDDDNKTNFAVILGIAFGGLIVVVSVIGSVLWYKKRKKTKGGKNDEDNYSNSQQQPSSVVTKTSASGPNMNKFRTISEEQLRMDEVLGSGCFGTVYSGVWSPDKNYCIPVAIKVLHESTEAHESREFMKEAFIMASMTNPSLQILLGICLSSKIMLVTQLMPLGSLKEYLEKNGKNISSGSMLTWCSQIAQGMEYLEDRRLVHRDLAARNVLMESPVKVKITDFGLAKLLNTNEETYNSQMEFLPVRWLAIESLQDGTFSHKSDVWAFGVTVWEILTYGGNPYEKIPIQNVKGFLLKGDRLEQPAVCTIDLHMILLTTWLLDPNGRPNFKELVQSFLGMMEDPGRYIAISGDGLLRTPDHIPQNDHELFRELASKMEIPRTNLVTFDEYLKLRDGYYVCKSDSDTYETTF